MTIEKKQELLLKALSSFYQKEKNLKILYNCIFKEGQISLRVIDYLCTNFAKNMYVVYYINSKDKIPFNLYLQYRAQLKAYSKMQFDPFRRHERIHIPCKFAPNNKLETTVAQMNFFKWAIENKVIEYLENEKNRIAVEEHMNNSGKDSSTKQFTGKPKRHNITVTVTFN